MERLELRRLRRSRPNVNAAIHQMERILKSRTFARVQRVTRRFLGFVVSKALIGQADAVKEMTIAFRVFRESAGFNPLESSKVRVAARALRRRLDAYYAKEGAREPIEIGIPIATYVPNIRDRRIAVALWPLENWHPLGSEKHLCATINDDLAAELVASGAVRIFRVAGRRAGIDVAEYGLRWSLEHSGNFVRLNVSLNEFSAGRIVLWRSFIERRDGVFRLTRSVAETILNVLAARGETHFGHVAPHDQVERGRAAVAR